MSIKSVEDLDKIKNSLKELFSYADALEKDGLIDSANLKKEGLKKANSEGDKDKETAKKVFAEYIENFQQESQTSTREWMSGITIDDAKRIILNEFEKR